MFDAVWFVTHLVWCSLTSCVCAHLLMCLFEAVRTRAWLAHLNVAALVDYQLLLLIAYQPNSSSSSPTATLSVLTVRFSALLSIFAAFAVQCYLPWPPLLLPLTLLLCIIRRARSTFGFYGISIWLSLFYKPPRYGGYINKRRDAETSSLFELNEAVVSTTSNSPQRWSSQLAN